MWNTRKQTKRKRKWIGPAAVLLMVGLFPARAASPNIPTNTRPKVATQCGGGETTEVAIGWGTCVAGGDCCGGAPEAQCARTGGSGGFQSV
jgi:hypothetical protein